MSPETTQQPPLPVAAETCRRIKKVAGSKTPTHVTGLPLPVLATSTHSRFSSSSLLLLNDSNLKAFVPAPNPSIPLSRPFFSYSFMQPEVDQSISNHESEHPSRNTDTSPAQHGNFPSQQSIPRDLCHGNGGAREDFADRLCDASSAAVAGATGVPAGNSINPANCERSNSPGERISEYENAYALSPKIVEELGFKVTPPRPNAPPRVSIEDFPNEVLTHILSHLPAASLSSMNLVNRRFHGLVTTPHAWRMAFSRYFLGPAAIEAERNKLDSDEFDHLMLKKRAFCRLTTFASWRNEYILRTRLLRSLARGKPAEYQSTGLQGSPRTGPIASQAVVTYNSLLLYPVTHIDGAFGSGLEKKRAVFIHGASEQGIASASDPATGKSGLGAWGISDPQMFNHFADSFAGETQWGLGLGELVGHPNVMDVSQQYGLIYGEGCPRGRAYFLSSSEKRGRFMALADGPAQPQLGIPRLSTMNASICSVWIAKSPQILTTTNGLCGGVLTAYAIGPNHSQNQRYERGQITARWVLCPGIPIVAIRIDDNFSTKRHAHRRIWAVILNALGEVFYLVDIPFEREMNPKPTPEQLNRSAWQTGRTVRWELVEATRRVAKADPFHSMAVDGSYTPRTSSDSMCLSQAQLVAETAEVEKYLAFKPNHFRKLCAGWDMQRKLEVDFAGDDEHGAGESITVITRGVTVGQAASLKRFTRLKFSTAAPSVQVETIPRVKSAASLPSVFGNSQPLPCVGKGDMPALCDCSGSQCTLATIAWTESALKADLPKLAQITTTAMDMSAVAQLTVSEDPLLSICGSSESSEFSTPVSSFNEPSDPAQIPGHRARFLAVGTSTGTVIVWDIRAPVSQNTEVINHVDPIRVINTDSPQVSSLGLTSLYLVHGGNDGLVQAWDALGSSLQPIRTINSRFSSRARRRLQQAETSVQGVGHNYFAAGAICLDPDPTRLRGIVSLGTQLRYWSYSSSAADQYRSNKRRLRYKQRGNNRSPEAERYSHTGRGALKDYIMNEQLELQRQKKEKEKNRRHLSGRFGVDLLGPDASEEQLLAYACMLSEESYTSDERTRRESGSSGGTNSSGGTVAPLSLVNAGGESSSFTTLNHASNDESQILQPLSEELEPDVAEAIRRSLEDVSMSSSTPTPSQDDNSQLLATDPGERPFEFGAESSASQQEVDDFELALQLSLVEQESQGLGEPSPTTGSLTPEDLLEDFPSLDNAATSSRSPRRGTGKGKGKRKA
ncbi:conserved hypothetical protein [Uncinocarpus reesii 1704]|uniref:F-box domain-containing protein n=1 Tax=Uncinocarpus reesii (strain UAMH 1704) TaxID=336963 RepID=C4JQG4_UNCRE|nr:uncharacterized protein UREG_04718 [Uncinocarpus reesii 1704]EEP79872.1 conserved hypothetical protein [Uncinocarpus reesii 1704]